MSLNSRDFLISAVENFKFNNEIGYRNAISRAYYSTYHKSLSQIFRMPETSFSHHSALIKYLASEQCFKNEQKDERILKELSLCLKQLRNARNKADYKLDTTIEKAAAAENMALALKIFDLWGDPQ